MPLLVFPIGAKPTQPNYIRGQTWPVKRTPKFSTIKHFTPSGARAAVSLYPKNPLWTWEFTCEVILNDPGRLNTSVYTPTVPPTDYAILEAFFHAQLGAGKEFVYQPPDSVVGGSASITSVQVASNVVTITANNSFVPGWYVGFNGLTGASFLHGQGLRIATATPTQFTCPFTHANYGPTADSGTAQAGQLISAPDANANSELVHIVGAYPTIPLGSPPVFTEVNESVQELNGSGLTALYVNSGTTGNQAWSNYTLLGANTTAPYEGYVIHYTVSPGVSVVIAQYTYYYRCAFADDFLDYEDFMYQLTSLKSLKIEQVRVVS